MSATTSTMKNLGPTGQVYFNKRGQRIAFRTFVPSTSNNNWKGVVIMLHGFTRHNNGPRWVELAQRLSSDGSFVVIAPDFAGHGYSEGQRAYIKSLDDLVDDQIELVKRLFGCKKPFGPNESVGELSNCMEKLADQPFIFLGESLGGLVAMDTYLKLKKESNNNQDYQKILNRFKGMVLCAPAILIPDPPPRGVIGCLQLFAMCCGRRALPAVLHPLTIDPHDFVDNEEETNFIFQVDDLAWNKAMPIQTMAGLGGSIQSFPKKLSDIDCPFITIHDPEDKVVSFAGSELLMSKSKTNPEQRKLVRVEGKQHILYITCPEIIFEQVCELL